MAKPKKPAGGDAERVHREMLEHLDQNPPPHRKTTAEPKSSASKKPTHGLAPGAAARPELMLRRLRYEEALARLETFLRLHFERGTAEVRIIHGKGLRSGEEGPVLRDAVRQFCDQHPHWVRSHHEAPRKEGGDGARIVRLRASG
jgi:DNA-nicking Smr family endonuclease